MEYAQKSISALGTEFVLKVPLSFSFLFEKCIFELERIEKTYSRFKGDSELSLLNTSLHKWNPITSEMKEIIHTSLRIHTYTKGYFDITIKETLEQKGYDATYSFREKAKKFSFLNWLYKKQQPITLRGNSVLLHKQIDFGGIGKGFAIDALGKILCEAPSYYINGGGDILVKGTWDIHLEHPDDTQKIIGTVSLTDGALCASSSNRRKWGKHHHLINPKTGESEHSMKALFILHDSAMVADAYATGLFASGFFTAIDIAKEQSLSVLLISSENKMYTHSFKGKLYG